MWKWIGAGVIILYLTFGFSIAALAAWLSGGNDSYIVVTPRGERKVGFWSIIFLGPIIFFF